MPDATRFVLVTGLSGAGKTQALRFLEDLGYYCVDNLPASLIPTLAELAITPDHPRKRIAVCVDARAGEDLEHLPALVESVAEQGVRPEVLFLDSSNQVLLHRYSESRRRHPAAQEGDVEGGIRRERQLLEPIRAQADLLIDTSATSVAELRERIAAMFRNGGKSQELMVTVVSFGFRSGLPPEADLVFDVRFLPNPHYEPDLRDRTGNESDVRDFVLSNPAAAEFLERLQGLLTFLLPQYAAERKSYLTIAVGCTGGRHRSVAVAHHLAVLVRSLNFNVRLRHRDIDQPT